MDSVFEKITLYDILGYVMPGSVIAVSVCGKVLMNYQEKAVDLYENFNGLFTYGFILFSFVCGVLMSELSRRFLQWREKKIEDDKKKIEFPVPEETVKSALIKANVIEEPTVDVKQYLEYMYGDIQSDKAYKRVHNYASAEVMYKNLAPSTLVSTIIVSSCFMRDFCIMGLIVVFGIICAWCFWKRRERFCEKKQKYVIGWYVEKYIGRKNAGDEE